MGKVSERRTGQGILDTETEFQNREHDLNLLPHLEQLVLRFRHDLFHVLAHRGEEMLAETLRFLPPVRSDVSRIGNDHAEDAVPHFLKSDSFIDRCGSDSEVEDLHELVHDRVQTEPVEPPHARFSFGCKAFCDLVAELPLDFADLKLG